MVWPRPGREGKAPPRSSPFLQRQVHLHRGIETPLAQLGRKRPAGRLRNVARDLERLVVAAAAQPFCRQRYRDDEVHVLARHGFRQQSSEKGRQRQLAAEFQRLHQHVGGEGVGERGLRGVVGGRLGEAATADGDAGRRERAARAEICAAARQISAAGTAQDRIGLASAKKAAATNSRLPIVSALRSIVR